MCVYETCVLVCSHQESVGTEVRSVSQPADVGCGQEFATAARVTEAMLDRRPRPKYLEVMIDNHRYMQMCMCMQGVSHECSPDSLHPLERKLKNSRYRLLSTALNMARNYGKLATTTYYFAGFELLSSCSGNPPSFRYE